MTMLVSTFIINFQQIYNSRTLQSFHNYVFFAKKEVDTELTWQWSTFTFYTVFTDTHFTVCVAYDGLVLSLGHTSLCRVTAAEKEELKTKEKERRRYRLTDDSIRMTSRVKYTLGLRHQVSAVAWCLAW